MVTNINEMVKAEMHLGHPTRKWNPKMAPYIYAERNGIYIIDLIQTYYHLKKVSKFLSEAASQGKKFLFIGTKKQASKLIEQAAKECDSHFVNQRWLGGMLTNWKTIKASIKKLNEFEIKEKNQEFKVLPKKQFATYKKDKERLEKYLSGLQTMTEIPDVVIIIGQVEEMNAVKECQKLGLRNVTILDTNCNPLWADLFVPANDDSVSSIKIILNEFVQSIIIGQKKYSETFSENKNNTQLTHAKHARKQ
jgi:small subunit ribosomal protein S2|uniref:Small ribosomal subunit protein uS2c n=1 Tax=Prasiola crispa TaxID=173492 RepID=A0A0R8S0W0_PRACR|nr:ribosomal protein S2 [Prasiola crispa]